MKVVVPVQCPQCDFVKDVDAEVVIEPRGIAGALRVNISGWMADQESTTALFEKHYADAGHR